MRKTSGGQGASRHSYTPRSVAAYFLPVAKRLFLRMGHALRDAGKAAYFLPVPKTTAPDSPEAGIVALVAAVVPDKATNPTKLVCGVLRFGRDGRRRTIIFLRGGTTEHSYFQRWVLAEERPPGAIKMVPPSSLVCWMSLRSDARSEPELPISVTK